MGRPTYVAIMLTAASCENFFRGKLHRAVGLSRLRPEVIVHGVAMLRLLGITDLFYSFCDCHKCFFPQFKEDG